MADFSNDVKVAAGFRLILPGETFSATFHRLEVYQIFGAAIVESATHTHSFDLRGDQFKLCIGSNINALCQKLHGVDYTDNEALWAKENNAASPYLLVSFGPTSEFTVDEGFVRIDDDKTHFWDCFPNARKMLADVSDRAVPILLASLSAKFASAHAQSRFLKRDIAFSGVDRAGRTIHDFRITVNARGITSLAYAGETINGMVKSALESLDGVGPRVAEFFSWAEREEDIVKKFILYFISLEMFSHKEFKLNFGNRTADEMEQMVGSAESNFPVSSEWLLKRKQREWTTLQERFVAGVMLRWANMDDNDVAKFGKLKKMRDNFLHGSTSTLTEQAVQEVRMLAVKVLSAA